MIPISTQELTLGMLPAATAFYFDKFEHRRPPPPLPHSRVVEAIWQILAAANLVAGAIYVTWRWTDLLNYDALWFAIPLVVAETCAYFGLILFTANLWKTRDYPRQPSPASIADCVRPDEAVDRPISVDVFIATYRCGSQTSRSTWGRRLRRRSSRRLDRKARQPR